MLTKIFTAIVANPNTELEVDLDAQTISIVGTDEKESFDISPYKKHNMLNGFDDIDYLQSIKPEIEDFASKLPF
jgi:3-isopropylmalate/(R)-2-methylmalate dehydratase small subunit